MQKIESRNSLLAKIHIGKKDLGLDDEAYRGMLSRVVGKQSAALCTLRELVRLVAELRAKGWEPPAKPSTRPAPPKATAALRSKVVALLADAKLPDEYADGIARRMYGRDSLRFCTPRELQGVVTALVRAAARRARAV